MTASEILEQIRRLPREQQYEVAEKVWAEFGDFDDDLTPEQMAELERRGENLARNPESGIPWETVRAELLQRYQGKLQPACLEAVAPFFSEATKLSFDDRVELAHRLWDEFMDGFQAWKAQPMPDGVFAWKTLKARIDAQLSRIDRLELAQQVWGNIQENGYDPELTPEEIAELDRRAEDALKHPERCRPMEEVFADIEKRYRAKDHGSNPPL